MLLHAQAIKELAPSINEMDITLMLACADRDNDQAISLEEFTTMMLHDHETDIPYWEKYGERDMHARDVKNRKHQIR